MKKKIEIDNKAIGQRIREEREKLRLSREEFAEIIGLSDYYVGQLERGDRQMSLPVMVKISSCLHVSLDYLILGETEYNAYRVHDSNNTYKAGGSNVDWEMNSLINKCSPKELALIKKLVQAILPYMSKN